jgi:hypothetical protein
MPWFIGKTNAVLLSINAKAWLDQRAARVKTSIQTPRL